MLALARKKLQVTTVLLHYTKFYVTTCWISWLVSRSKDTRRGWCPPM